MSDTPTLCRFELGWHHDGSLSKDGLPVYTEVVFIQLDRPPLLSLRRVAAEEDYEAYPDPYRLFQKEMRGRKETEGFPLVMWPALSPMEVKLLAHHDIFTVEQLAKLAKNDKLPPEIKEHAVRAATLISMMNSTAKHEATITDLRAQLKALEEEIGGYKTTISAQNSMLDQYKARVA